MRHANLIDEFIEKLLGRKIPKSLLQFFRYLVSGGAATVADMVVLFILNQLLHVHYLLAAGLGFSVGVATNYTLNILLVFKSTGKIKKEFALFLIIGLGGLALTELIMWLLVQRLQVYVMLAKVVAVILVLNWNFFMRKKFVFAVSDSRN